MRRTDMKLERLKEAHMQQHLLALYLPGHRTKRICLIRCPKTVFLHVTFEKRKQFCYYGQSRHCMSVRPYLHTCHFITYPWCDRLSHILLAKANIVTELCVLDKVHTLTQFAMATTITRFWMFCRVHAFSKEALVMIETMCSLHHFHRNFRGVMHFHVLTETCIGVLCDNICMRSLTLWKKISFWLLVT